MQSEISKLIRRFSYLSLSSRIVLGNSIIIVIGAIGGTLLTSKLSGEAASLWLILFFAAVGVTMSILLNSWIVRKSLQPLNKLHRLVERVAAGQTEINTRQYEEFEPEFQQLSNALNAIWPACLRSPCGQTNFIPSGYPRSR